MESAKFSAAGHPASSASASAPAVSAAPDPAPVIDRETLRDLMQPSLWRWSIRVAADWSLIIVAMLVAARTHAWAAYVLAVLVAGIGQHRLAIMAHEGTHRQISRHKRFNDFLTGFLCLWPFGNPVGGYRRFHFTHHRYLNTEQDSELLQKANSAPAWDLPATRWTVLKYLLRDVCLLHLLELKHLSRRVRPGTGWIDGSLPNLWLLSVAGTLLYCGQWRVIVIWYLGTAMVFWPIFRLRVWTEHVGTDESHRIHAPWYLRLWLLPHNTWCHYEHHHFPQVPCWNLRRVRKLMGDTPAVVPLTAVIHALEHAPRTISGVPMGGAGNVPSDWQTRLVGDMSRGTRENPVATPEFAAPRMAKAA
jgi:fatty acid desaturase